MLITSLLFLGGIFIKLNTLYEGDCREILTQIEDNSIDSIVTDPPYELTQSKKSKKGFMGKEWDGSGIAYDEKVWSECMRVLKPGAYCLAFGGSRTFHRLVCAIEDVGFIIHPMIGWVFGSGFPKATNLSKQFDKVAGAERKITGKEKYDALTELYKIGEDKDNIRTDINITESSTDLAKKWDGYYYGRQSLKPALEPICMAQKPISEKRMVDNVVKWGVGAINVDGCRVGSDTVKTMARSDTKHGKSNSLGSSWSGNIDESERTGRFPANLILQHSPGCERVGDKKVKTGKGTRGSYIGTQDRYDGKGYGIQATYEPVGFADPDGTETIPSYECEEDCPIKLMNEQSGISKSATGGTKRKSSIFLANNNDNLPWHNFGDTGGASRYFKNIDPDPFFYCAKASKKERGENNSHPTVKPIKLLTYLVRLVTPPNGTILDPFIGSGSTAIAAKQENFNYIGIELNAEYINIANDRIENYKYK